MSLFEMSGDVKYKELGPPVLLSSTDRCSEEEREESSRYRDIVTHRIAGLKVRGSKTALENYKSLELFLRSVVMGINVDMTDGLRFNAEEVTMSNRLKAAELLIKLSINKFLPDAKAGVTDDFSSGEGDESGKTSAAVLEEIRDRKMRLVKGMKGEDGNEKGG